MNITSYLSGNTATSGVVYAPGANSSTASAIFQFFANSPAYGPPLGQNGMPMSSANQTIVLTLNLCNATWDTSLSLVDPFSKQLLAW